MKKAKRPARGPQRAPGGDVSCPGAHPSLPGKGRLGQLWPPRGCGDSSRASAQEPLQESPTLGRNRTLVPKTHRDRRQDAFSLSGNQKTALLPVRTHLTASRRAAQQLSTPAHAQSVGVAPPPATRACDWSAARPGRGAQLPIGQRSESCFRSRRFQIRARVGRSLFAS